MLLKALELKVVIAVEAKLMVDKEVQPEKTLEPKELREGGNSIEVREVMLAKAVGGGWGKLFF